MPGGRGSGLAAAVKNPSRRRVELTRQSVSLESPRIVVRHHAWHSGHVHLARCRTMVRLGALIAVVGMALSFMVGTASASWPAALPSFATGMALDSAGNVYTSAFNPDDYNHDVLASAVQPDGKILIGGSFSGSFRRLNADGTPDAAFNANVKAAGVWGGIWNIAIQPDHKILITQSSTIRRLNADGTADLAFNTNAATLDVGDFGMYSLALQSDGKVLVGGVRYDDQNNATYYVKRLNSDGLPDTAFNTNAAALNLDFTVVSITQQGDGKILIAGGAWSTIPDDYSRAGRVMRVNADGTADSDTPFNANVTALALDGAVETLLVEAGGTILIGGEFTNGLKRLNADGTADGSTPLNANIATVAQDSDFNSVYAIAVQTDGSILIGGFISGCLMRLHANGTADTTFNGAVDLGYCGLGSSARVTSIQVQTNGTILAGGYITASLALLNANGTSDAAFGAVIYGMWHNGTLSKFLPDGTPAGGVWPITIGPSPRSLTTDGADNLYLVDSRTGTVSKFLPDGRAAGGNWPVTVGSSAGSVAIDPAGSVYVATNGGVSKYLPDGTRAGGKWPITMDSGILATDLDGNLLVSVSYELFAADPDASFVIKILPDGTPAGGNWPVRIGGHPGAMVVDPSGNVYTANSRPFFANAQAADDHVSKILPDGTLAGGNWPAPVGPCPYDITIDAAGNLYTSIYGCIRFPFTDVPVIAKVLPDGTVATGTWPIATDRAPSNILLDATGNIFATLSNNTVAKFTGAGPAPPATPTAATAVAGDSAATITIKPNPLSARHGAPSTYTVTTVQDASKRCVITVPATTCVITGLKNKTAYSFTTTARLLAWETRASARSNEITPRVQPPAAPTRIRWSTSSTTTTAGPFTATFEAAPDTAYTITATRISTRTTRAAKTARGTCTITTNQKTKKRTTSCSIRLKQAGTWRVAITPIYKGVKGTPATTTVRARPTPTPRPTAPTGITQPVTG